MKIKILFKNIIWYTEWHFMLASLYCSMSLHYLSELYWIFWSQWWAEADWLWWNLTKPLIAFVMPFQDPYSSYRQRMPSFWVALGVSSLFNFRCLMSFTLYPLWPARHYLLIASTIRYSTIWLIKVNWAISEYDSYGWLFQPIWF